jgi:hypothetical protein
MTHLHFKSNREDPCNDYNITIAPFIKKKNMTIQQLAIIQNSASFTVSRS